MDDTESLRRTVRRCTAVLVAAIGAGTGAPAGPPGTLVAAVLTGAAVLYLLGSVVFGPSLTRDADRGDGVTDG
ncbi:hypothetical protein [Haloarcula halophila]|uniref:hypothetical protein n=1 Tax=Haloarcula TaxID=2237 RepID=UPI0023E3AAE7|nr:hypothetical protein [Halomicroarcula sp. DFY41]